MTNTNTNTNTNTGYEALDLIQSSASYREEAAAIMANLELYSLGQDYTPEGLIAQLEGAWRYARQRAEELWDAGK